VSQSSGADQRSTVPPPGACAMVNSPDASCARSCRFRRPLPVMSPVMPCPSSMTSIQSSSSTVTVTVRVLAPECRREEV
jgi:hypothetical protein